jgi:hypothetical protein
MERTEPAAVFDKWMSFSILSAALRKKVFLQLGRLTYYPNLYVIFVAEPGIARKTQAINFGMELVDAIPDILVSADCTTVQALFDDLENSAVDEPMRDGTMLRHSSVYIVSREFESFIGNRKDNTRMLTILTDFYDCPKTWKYKTKHSGTNNLPSLFATIIAATTPTSLSNSLPASSIGDGFTSRILFVWADKKKRKEAIPYKTKEDEILEDKLKKDLYIISRLSGSFTMDNPLREKWTAWYDKYEEQDEGRLCKDNSFNGWYSRKPSMILRVAMLISASRSNDMVMSWEDIQKAIKEIESVERMMGQAFRAVGKSMVSGEVETVVQVVKERKAISEKQLMSMIWRDVDSNSFDNVISTAIRRGNVRRKYESPTGEKGNVWYYYEDMG